MRISDWSSDVCSSDLGGPLDLRRGARQRQPVGTADPLCSDDRQCGEAAVGTSDPAAGGGGRAGGSGVARHDGALDAHRAQLRSEEHTSELQSLMRISYAVFCLKKKKKPHRTKNNNHTTS